MLSLPRWKTVARTGSGFHSLTCSKPRRSTASFPNSDLILTENEGKRQFAKFAAQTGERAAISLILQSCYGLAYSWQLGLCLQALNNGVMSITNESDIQKSNWRPFGLSLALHTLLIVLLLVLINRIPPRKIGDDIRRGSLVLALTQTDQPTDYLTEDDTPPAEESQRPTAEPADASLAPPPAIEIPQLPELPGQAAVDTMDVNNMADVPKNSATPQAFSLSEDDLKMIAKEQRELKAKQPVGPPASIRVFGSGQLTGRRFVFVIDRSKSMGSQGLGVLNRAVEELSSAINQLEATHQFQIVAYHDRTITMSRRALLPASDFNKQQAPEFIDGLMAFGGTSHQNGMSAALAFQPDIVVLMTDAGFPDLHGGHLKEIEIMSRGNVQIHTIQFGSGPLQETENFMKQLARQSQGSFRYIDVNQWYRK